MLAAGCCLLYVLFCQVLVEEQGLQLVCLLFVWLCILGVCQRGDVDKGFSSNVCGLIPNHMLYHETTVCFYASASMYRCIVVCDAFVFAVLLTHRSWPGPPLRC